ncbi:MAG: hypothetical protein Sylvanvirus23_3 [Sylvanvirus sp.]|uniref:Uncharacterized protein n=1 Tax=Sylvanvirus sp. TaxID=2487774 RepID=A0A3G5AIV3_9VIRU|nr:MAG: hypothetical protein Sylvanvirus23_3 [Sylvanvirus sp.]
MSSSTTYSSLSTSSLSSALSSPLSSPSSTSLIDRCIIPLRDLTEWERCVLSLLARLASRPCPSRSFEFTPSHVFFAMSWYHLKTTLSRADSILVDIRSTLNVLVRADTPGVHCFSIYGAGPDVWCLYLHNTEESAAWLNVKKSRCKNNNYSIPVYEEISFIPLALCNTLQRLNLWQRASCLTFHRSLFFYWKDVCRSYKAFKSFPHTSHTSLSLSYSSSPSSFSIQEFVECVLVGQSAPVNQHNELCLQPLPRMFQMNPKSGVFDLDIHCPSLLIRYADLVWWQVTSQFYRLKSSDDQEVRRIYRPLEFVKEWSEDALEVASASTIEPTSWKHLEEIIHDITHHYEQIGICLFIGDEDGDTKNVPHAQLSLLAFHATQLGRFMRHFVKIVHHLAYPLLYPRVVT